MKEYQEKEQLIQNAINSMSGDSDLEKYAEETPIDDIPNGSDLEIVVTPEGEEPQDRREDQAVEEPRKKNDRSAQRKAQFTRAARQRAELQQIAQHQAEEIAALREQVAQQTNYSQIQREQQLKERTDTVADLMKRAKEEGNIDQEVEATKLMSKYNAELVNLKNNPKQPQVQNGYDQGYGQPQAPYNPVLEDVYAENDWLVQGSDNYDPELVTEAQQAEIALARQWRLAGYGDQVGSHEFYKNVVGMVKERHGLPTQDEQRQPPQVQPRQSYNNGRNMNQSRQQYVAPVDRNLDTGNIRQVGSRLNVTLTPEQRELARMLPLRDANGNQASDTQKEIAYAKQLVKGDR